MERKEYLDRCKEYAMRGNKFVNYQNVTYAPISYQLSFRADGTVKHTAILKDINANSLIYCRLEEIK